MNDVVLKPQSIPRALRNCPQWVVWRLEGRDGKPTKVPYSANGRRASVTDSTTWATYEIAVQSCRDDDADGVGFVFTSEDEFCGVDLDRCRNADTGALESWATNIIEQLDSYTEVSPSGTGVHIFVRAKLQGTRRRKGKIEMYDSKRFFCVTGDHVEGTPTAIEERQVELDALYAATFGTNATSGNASTPNARVKVLPSSSDEVVTAWALKKYPNLWGGNWEQKHNSQSEADLCLCGHLAYRCGPDQHSQVTRIFRESGLGQREKASRNDYMGTTVAAAYRGRTVFWKPPTTSAEGARPRPGYLTELWGAELMVKQYGRDLRYSSTHGWVTWDGRRWRRDDTGAVEGLVKRTVRSIYGLAAKEEDKDTRRAMIEFGRSCERAVKMRAIISLSRSEDGIPIRSDQLDANLWLLNCENGTVNLKTGELQPHSRGDLITKLAPSIFDPNAACPLWLGFLSRIFGNDATMIAFVQRALGSSLSGAIREHVLHVLYGTGANGKTVLTGCITAMLGDYGQAAAPGLLLAKNSDQHPTERADLWGKRLVVSAEAGEGKRFNEELVKQLTGADRIKARFMRQDFFEFTPTHTLLVATNHKPEVRGTDLAIWRRLKLWPFLVTIPDSEQDLDLAEKLRGEWPGILAWCVRGCIAWRKQGLAAPEPVDAATKEYREESDIIGQFIEECCDEEDGLSVRGSAVYWAFSEWCKDNGGRAMNNNRFSRQLRERAGIAWDFDKAERKFRVYEGVSLTAEMQAKYDRHMAKPRE